MALSAYDSTILNALFDPEATPSSDSQFAHIDSTLPVLPFRYYTTETITYLQNREFAYLLPLEVSSPSPTAIGLALEDFNVLIAQEPRYASAYNNRAQVLRLLHGDDLYAPGLRDSNVLQDLQTAVNLASPASPTCSVSPFQAKVLASAHTQYGYLLFQAANSSASAKQTGGPSEIAGRSSEVLEEMASAQFAMGGRYGNKLAKEMAVRTNPYAKMCGGIVREAMRKEVEEGQMLTMALRMGDAQTQR